MNRPNARVGVVLLITLVSGCSSPVVSDAEMKPPAAGKILSAHLLNQSAKSVPVTIKRDREYMLFSCSIRFYVDSRPVVDLDPGAGVVIYLAPGVYALAAEICPGLGGGGIAEHQAQITSAKPARFRISAADGSYPSIQPTSF